MAKIAIVTLLLGAILQVKGANRPQPLLNSCPAAEFAHSGWISKYCMYIPVYMVTGYLSSGSWFPGMLGRAKNREMGRRMCLERESERDGERARDT